ncbi:MAG TPA: hypothetical protein VLA42_07760 [Verrucomicrobiae bacterium]|jgi:hypothetical protein|nr:hypothetical protein [Verrucomicrobiae bacterium]
MKVHEFEKIVNKLGLKVRNSGDRLAWFEYDGQTVIRTKRSHGNKEQPGNLIRQQLKLNEKQLAGLISCKVSVTDYVDILKSKGIIASQPTQEPAPLPNPSKPKRV